MKTSNVILLALGAVAVYYYTGLGVAGADVQIVFTDVQIKSVGDYIMTLLVQNVSNSAIVVNSLAGDLTVNGNELGNISTFTPVTIPGNSQVPVTLEVKPALLSLPATVIDLVNNSGGNLIFNATGHANINNLVLPFNLDKTITV